MFHSSNNKHTKKIFLFKHNCYMVYFRHTGAKKFVLLSLLLLLLRVYSPVDSPVAVLLLLLLMMVVVVVVVVVLLSLLLHGCLLAVLVISIYTDKAR